MRLESDRDVRERPMFDATFYNDNVERNERQEGRGLGEVFAGF